MELAVDDDALRARRGFAGAYETDAPHGDRSALLAGARRSSIDRRAAAGTSPPASAFAYRYAASTSPNMMPAAFLHQEMEPMVSSRALPPQSLTSSTSPTTSFTPGFYSNSDASRSSAVTWTARSTGNTRALSSSSSTAATPSFHWSPTPLGALYVSQTPLLAPSAAANALATMSMATTSVLSAMPPPTPTPSLTANGVDTGGSSTHSWRFSATLNSWNGLGSSANGGGTAPPSHWMTNDEQQQPPPPLQLSPLTRGRGYLSTSPLNSRLMAQMPPLVLPPPPPASTATATTIKPPATRKRKRAPGAQRLRNFLCMHPSCGKSFTDSAHLRDHTVVHTGEKRLSCAICDRRFARLSTLHEHQRVHTGEKPYVCSTPGCEKRYSSRAALRVHVATHSGVTGSHRKRNGNARHVSSTGYAGDTEQASVTTERLGERAELTLHVYAHERYPASYGYSVGDQPSYMAPPTAELVPSATAAENAADAMDASHATPIEHTTTSISEQSDEVPVVPSTRSLEDTVREQRDQIAVLQQELERLRQQPQPELRKKPSRRKQGLASATRRADEEATDAAPAAKVAAPMTAPVEFLQDGVKPFACCVCSQRFVNYYQLTFHVKQHAGAALVTVVGQNQAPLPVGPKFCPERGCEFSEVTGRSLRSLQTLKRHWQRRHQLDRPHVCAICPPHQRKAFKTRENLKAHEKDCRRLLAVSASASVST